MPGHSPHRGPALSGLVASLVTGLLLLSGILVAPSVSYAAEETATPELAQVPDVRGMTGEQADAAITAAGLKPRFDVLGGEALEPYLSEVSGVPPGDRIIGSEPAGGALVTPGSTVYAWFPAELAPEPEEARTNTAQLVHTLFNLDPEEQGSSELVCTYQGEAIMKMDGGLWSLTYSGEDWHSLDGAVFVCGGGSGGNYIATGSYTLDPLTFTRDGAGCARDEFSFDGTTLSGSAHAYCGDGDVYTYEVTVGSNG